MVVVGGKRLRCPAAELVPAGDAPTGEAPQPTAGRRGAAAAPSGRARARAEIPEARTVARELNLIGQRVEPALEALDAYLDQALLASQSEVRIVHGHGTGRLREAVREHLRGHPAVASQRPGRREEGGDGATVVTLRG
jgi:DNA mismatch repair protein MutS2